MRLYILVLGSLIPAQAFCADKLTLVASGKSAYSICISREASPLEKRAALELQRLLEEVSGARLPIVTDAEARGGSLILLGKSAALNRLGMRILFEALGTEGFALRTHGRYLIIAGSRQRGTLYGVYTFLEKLGCRWFTPDVSRIPRMSTVAVEPLNEIQKPSFEYRDLYFSGAKQKDWAARNETNGHHSELN